LKALKRHKEDPEQYGVPPTPNQCKGIILKFTDDEEEKM
jgi:hypothetical protein